MGFLDRLFGRDDARPEGSQSPPSTRGGQASSYRDAAGQYAPPPSPGAGDEPVMAGSDEDRQAIERYRYLLRTAPPETIEQVHAEAFGRLTDAQRQQVLADLSSTLPPSERPVDADPQSMARAATRAEYTQPGFMERTFGNRSFGGGGQGGSGFGSMLGASMLGTIGGYVVGSALVSAFMMPAYAADPGSGDDGADTGGDGGADGADASADAGGDTGGFGDVGGDFGGDFGGFDGF
jgi:hypothetical protein